MRFWQVLLSFSFALAFSSKGDSWMAPREFDSASENGRFIAVIKPATGTNNATATIYGVTNANRTQIWCAELSNRVAPASVLVSGDGRIEPDPHLIDLTAVQRMEQAWNDFHSSGVWDVPDGDEEQMGLLVWAIERCSDEVGPDRSLLICCTAFRCDPSQFPNLTLKKIPNAVLTRCEWGKDDYSLAVANLPPKPVEPGTQTSLFEEAQL